MSLLFSAVIFLVFVIGIIRGIQHARPHRDPFQLGAITASISAIGITASLITVILGIYSLATFDERATHAATSLPATLALITRICERVISYSFIGALIGNLLLILQRKSTKH